MNEIDILANCPVCKAKYNGNDTRIVRNNERAMLIHTQCPKCSSSFLAVVSKGAGMENLVTMGVLTDLNYREACNLLPKEPVSCNEVLDLYEK